MVKRIEYNIEGYLCKDKCPHTDNYIGSAPCFECIHNEHQGEYEYEKKFVLCNHPKWYKQNKTTMTDKDKILQKIEEIITVLKRCNPSPLGSMQQCLASAEIEALNLIKDYINSLNTSSENYEANTPTEYGKYVDECLNEAAEHFYSEGEDKYSVADLFYAGVRCGKSWNKVNNKNDD